MATYRQAQARLAAELAAHLAGLLLRLGWRFRAGLMPLWVGLGLLVAGWVGSSWSMWWPTPILAGLVVAGVVWFHGELLSPHAQRVWLALVPESMDDGGKGILDRPTERGYLALLLLGAGSWCSARMQYGLTQPVLLAWAALVVALGVPWWWHRGFRRRRPLNTWARRWARVNGNDDLKVWHGSRVTAVEAKGRTTTLVVKLRSGRTVKHVGADSLILCSVLGLRPGAVTVAMDHTAARRVLVRVVPRDPWKGAIVHPLPRPGSLLLSERSRVQIGRYEDGSVCDYKLGQHLLCCGATGSGKSVMIESLLCHILACQDAAVVAADLASGATLDIWRGVLVAPLATSVEDAFSLLGRVFAVVEHRERILAERKRAGELIDVLPPTPESPALFVIIDEFPDLIKGSGKNVITVLERLAAKARKTGVWLIFGAQNPTANDVGSTELRGALTATIGLGLSDRQSQTLWGSGARSEGWDSTPLTNGTFLLRDREEAHQTPRVAKGLYITPQQRRDLIAAATINRAVLDPGSAAILAGVPQMVEPSRSALTLLPGGQAPSQPAREFVTAHSPTVDPIPAPSRAARNAELDERVFAEIPDEHQGGIGGTEIALQLNVSRDRVKRAFARLAAKGQIKSHPRGDGTWCRNSN